MKPLFILMTIASSFFVKSSNAADDVTPAAVKSFQSTFANAKDAQWSASLNGYKVQFSMNEQVVTAFYNEVGELMGVTRNISSLQLPIILQTEIKKDYSNYWISDLFELSSANGTEYYLTLEDADSKIVLKSSGNSSWTNFQKSRK